MIYTKTAGFTLGVVILAFHFAELSGTHFPYLLWEFLHLLGGLALGLIFYEEKRPLMQTLLYVLIIGIIWEAYELYYQKIAFWLVDTVLDLILEIIGTCTVYFFASWLAKKPSLQREDNFG